MVEQFVSFGTFVMIIVGAIVAIYYLYYMGAALRKSVRTRNDPDEGQQDRFHYSLVGAVISVVASMASIAIFGLGGTFLYWGPILAVLAAIAVAYSLREELVT
jgi:hypothetical protein